MLYNLTSHKVMGVMLSLDECRSVEEAQQRVPPDHPDFCLRLFTQTSLAPLFTDCIVVRCEHAYPQ
jgi:hypothetical protein